MARIFFKGSFVKGPPIFCKGSINLCLPNIHAHINKKKVGWFGSYFVITFLKGWIVWINLSQRLKKG